MPLTSAWKAGQRWTLVLYLVDDVDAEIEVDGFIAKNVLVLLSDADHFAAAAE